MFITQELNNQMTCAHRSPKEVLDDATRGAFPPVRKLPTASANRPALCQEAPRWIRPLASSS